MFTDNRLFAPVIGLAGFLIGVLILIQAPAVSAQVNYQQLRSFGQFQNSEGLISGPVIQDTNQFLYGLAQTGGLGDGGVIWRMPTNGVPLEILHHFNLNSDDGRTPMAGLLLSSDGRLFGTTSRGGSNDLGTVFTLNPDGTSYATLHHFGVTAGDGTSPECILVEGSDGELYGTTVSGGTADGGTVFTMSKNGTGYAVLHSFGQVAGDGLSPTRRLVEASNGTLYGTTTGGGNGFVGTIFRLERNGTGYSVVRNFSSGFGEGQIPAAGMIEGSDGVLYGSTTRGGNGNFGILFRILTDGTGYNTIHHFQASGVDGWSPTGELLEASDGLLYGTTLIGGSRLVGTVFRVSRQGTGFQALKSFSTVGGDGWNPTAGLLEDSSGLLFGTTSAGGSFSGGSTDGGTVFRLRRNGTGYGIIRNFSRTGGDGQSPVALTEASNGFLYGTTSSGGSMGGGILFRIASDGNSFSNLHEFATVNNIPGQQLPSRMIEASDGALYGTTTFGGANEAGSIYRLDPNGNSFSTVFDFEFLGQTGRNPADGIIEGVDGNFYGVTQFGGSANAGVVFRVNMDGSGYTNIHVFGVDDSHGRNPSGNLIQARDGHLFGTAASGGDGLSGTLFRVETSGANFTVLHQFNVTANDGRSPQTRLLEGQDGLLYGSTLQGGMANGGTLYRIDTNGNNYAIFHEFASASTNGSMPSWLVQVDNGRLFGTTPNGGSMNDGAVFSVDPDGSNFVVDYEFQQGPDDGLKPFFGLSLASDGSLFGTTGNGGLLGLGTLYKLELPEPDVFLSISREGSNVILTWPVSAQGYTLQETPSVNPPIPWQNSAATVVVEGDQNKVTLSGAEAAQFFRLMK